MRRQAYERQSSSRHWSKRWAGYLSHTVFPGDGHDGYRSVSRDDFPASNFVALPLDFTTSTAVPSAIASVGESYRRLDVLANIVGGFADGKTVAETDDATREQMRDLNLTSAFYVLRAAIPHLRKSGAGRIVAVGSLAAVEPHAGLGAYVTFKSAW